MSITVLTIKSSQIRMPTQPALWAIRVSSRSRAVSRSSNVAGWAFWARKPSSLQISRTILCPPQVVFSVIVAVWPGMRKGHSAILPFAGGADIMDVSSKFALGGRNS